MLLWVWESENDEFCTAINNNQSQFSYKKTDSDVWVLNTDDIPFDKSIIKDQQIVHFAVQSTSGNHKHSRVE